MFTEISPSAHRCCISGRKPLTLLIHVTQWLARWMREALNAHRDIEVMELWTAQTVIRRLICELLQSHGGPSDPSVRAIVMLIRVDVWLTHWLTQARTKGQAESVELLEARRTVRRVLYESLDSRRK